MELLVPLIIFAIGGIISYLNDSQNKQKERETPRNIDFDKLNEKYQKSKREAVDEFKRLKEEYSNFEPKKEVEKVNYKVERKIQDTVKKKVDRPVQTKMLDEVKDEVKKDVKNEVRQSVTEESYSKKSLSFDKEAVVNGIIMKEVLGPPRSKERRVR